MIELIMIEKFTEAYLLSSQKVLHDKALRGSFASNFVFISMLQL